MRKTFVQLLLMSVTFMLVYPMAWIAFTWAATTVG